MSTATTTPTYVDRARGYSDQMSRVYSKVKPYADGYTFAKNGAMCLVTVESVAGGVYYCGKAARVAVPYIMKNGPTAMGNFEAEIIRRLKCVGCGLH